MSASVGACHQLAGGCQITASTFLVDGGLSAAYVTPE
jgi:hypothetical protein